MVNNKYAFFSFILTLGFFLFLPQYSDAKKYTHAGQIYTFEYPDGWNARRIANLVYFGPAEKGNDASCFSMVMDSSNSVGGSAEKIIEGILESGVGIAAISAADDSAKKFEASKYEIANSFAQRVIYEHVTKENVPYKTSQILTFNTSTGHTIDITCSAPVEIWDTSGDVFDRIQSSLTVLSRDNAPFAEGPDFIGDKQENVLEKMKILRENITRLRVSDGSNISPETTEELKTPVIPYEDGKRVVNRGILTAMAEYCDLDWQDESFTPFMQQERRKRIWSDKQIAFIGGLHGMTQGSMLKSFQKNGECSDNFRNKTQAMLDGSAIQ